MFLDSWDYTINHNENEDENRSHRHDINRPRLKHGHKIVNIESILLSWWFYVLSNTPKQHS